MGNFTEQILVDTARVMSQERSVINGATAMFVSPVVDFYQSMSPFLLLALVLIVADTRFGVAAARKQGAAFGRRARALYAGGMPAFGSERILPLRHAAVPVRPAAAVADDGRWNAAAQIES